MTFSLVARDPGSGAFGIVVCSSSPAVASRCAHPRATVGVVASQNVTNPRARSREYSTRSQGVPMPKPALKAVLAQEQFPDYRQVTVVDAAATPPCTRGPQPGRAHPRAGDQAVAAGNLLKDEGVITALLTGYAPSASAAFEERLLDGLRAADAAGGEEGPVHSAGLVVVEDVSWPVTDLRVDYADDPLAD